VQVRISAEDGQLLCVPEKYDLVRVGAEGDVATHERIHLGTTALASMNEADNTRQQVPIGNLSADTDQEGHPGLDLMPIRTSLYAGIRDDQRKLFSLPHAQANALIDERAVALASAKSVPQQIGGIQDIIEQPDLPKVDIAR